MRKIEKQMIQAIQNKQHWALDNTWVKYDSKEDVSFIGLHGNHIADYWHLAPSMNLEPLRVNIKTLAQCPSNTTKSRLRALGANVTTKKGVTYLDGVAI